MADVGCRLVDVGSKLCSDLPKDASRHTPNAQTTSRVSGDLWASVPDILRSNSLTRSTRGRRTSPCPEFLCLVF